MQTGNRGAGQKHSPGGHPFQDGSAGGIESKACIREVLRLDPPAEYPREAGQQQIQRQIQGHTPYGQTQPPMILKQISAGQNPHQEKPTHDG
ncbi:hypothetical protein D3C76_1596680 [compost metagenome]